MKIFTQINRPDRGLRDDDVWLPCLSTSTVEHVKAQKQPLIVTHISAIDHYEFDLDELFDQPVHCVGPVTRDRLRERGFQTVQLHGFRAEDIKPNTPATWLHGDRYTVDFSERTGITGIQTYETRLRKESLDRVVAVINAGSPAEIHCYSKRVVDYLEDSEQALDLSKVVLYHTTSCSPTANRWRSVVEFYPTAKAPLLRDHK